MKTLKEALREVDWSQVHPTLLRVPLQDLQALIEDCDKPQQATPVQRRVQLAHDIFSCSGETLELPFDSNLLYAFSDGVAIGEWCSSLGISFQVNPSPKPEFRSITTLIFRDVRGANPNLMFETSEDDEL